MNADSLFGKRNIHHRGTETRGSSEVGTAVGKNFPDTIKECAICCRYLSDAGTARLTPTTADPFGRAEGQRRYAQGNSYGHAKHKKFDANASYFIATVACIAIG